MKESPLQIHMYSKNVCKFSQRFWTTIPPIHPRFIYIYLASRDFQKEVQGNSETPCYLSRSTFQENSVIRKLGMIDGLSPSWYADARDVPFISDSVQPSAEKICDQNVEEMRHWESFPNSPLTLEE